MFSSTKPQIPLKQSQKPQLILDAQVAYWYLYLFQETVEIDFNTGGLASAVAEAVGPTGHSRHPHQQHPEVIDGQAPSSGEGSDTNTSYTMHLPHSGAGMQGGISKELSAEKFGPGSARRAVDEEKTAAL